jgi:ABC-type antimicrobial peptide transport system permease subunit
LIVRTADDPAALAEPLRQAIRDTAANLQASEIVTLTGEIQTAARRERLLAWLSGAFGALALILASAGLYGMTAYAAELRTQEMGIRLALGARPRDVRWLLLGELGRLLGAGIVIGGAAALALTQSLDTLLYDLTPQDPATLAAAAGTLAVVALVACYVPARRASKLDPMTTLRQT